MMAPLYKYGLFGDETALIVAFAVGIGFGFFLERAGFGSAKKLTAQFYLTDLAVFKVMFTAIVTALVGLFYLSWIGWVDLSLVYVAPTYLWPQVVGGLVLGAGFVVGGYCPGTSMVAIATGRIDALVNALGVAAGILVFGEVYPWLAGFYGSSAMGKLTLPELLHLRYGLVVFAVVLLALAGFWGAGRLERRYGGVGSVGGGRAES